ncbi:MAG: hypothetical protein LC541_18735 [Candidatus Thiodiazotropha sp.]|nr:hypothetical protein [Candidatus Thiodiazotropha sp.]MCM8885305.1 hypothetical protein [Candidatus Thiodiazotropha sp.]MCM8921568.1 hypothetical protein [Candidatus Thiodiazotropha sp.]
MRDDLAKLLEAEPCPIETFLSFPELGGTKAQRFAARHVRDLAISRLLRALADHPGDKGRPTTNQLGKLFRWGIEAMPPLAPLIEMVRNTDDARWWLDVASGPPNQIDKAPFYALTSAIKLGSTYEEVGRMVSQLLEVGCNRCRADADTALNLAETESQMGPFPGLTGTARQIEWARSIRIELIEAGMVSIKKAQRIRRAKWWIEKKVASNG